MRTVILGAGVAGLSCSYHIGHERCLILEARPHWGGHAANIERNGFIWDEGPHVSFTRNHYVRALFSDSVASNFNEFPVHIRNWYRGHWIDHPAQLHFFQIPEPIRSLCLQSIPETDCASKGPAANYRQWLNEAFGSDFAEQFPAAYTRKYWTCEPELLSTDWIGSRVTRPDARTMKLSAEGPLPSTEHYISSIRYPSQGGFASFLSKLALNANIRYNSQVQEVDLAGKEVTDLDGQRFRFDRLISTIPLPSLVRMCKAVPQEVLGASSELWGTELVLTNVSVAHQSQIAGDWFYVYDQDKLATRISTVERLSGSKVMPDLTGIQVESYFSKHKPQTISESEIAKKVISELIEMGFIQPSLLAAGTEGVRYFTHRVPLANVAFDTNRADAQSKILEWLARHGLKRESDDLDPMTDWDSALQQPREFGSIVLAGRFGQWKYFWTDDCVLRGKAIGLSVRK